MKKLWLLLVTAALLSGCATMTVSKLTADNRMNLVHLSRGMSKAKALAIMGSRVSVYNCDWVVSNIPLKVTINNPYRTEMIETSGRTLEVVYYVTSINNDKCIIEEAGLTPLVFEDARLIGWGKDFLSSLIPAAKTQIEPQPEQADNVQAPAPAAVEKEQAVEKPTVEQKEVAQDIKQPEQSSPDLKQANQTTKDAS